MATGAAWILLRPLSPAVCLHSPQADVPVARPCTQIRVLQYDPDQEQLVCKQCLIHANEIWDIAPCPTSEELLITVWSKGVVRCGTSGEGDGAAMHGGGGVAWDTCMQECSPPCVRLEVVEVVCNLFLNLCIASALGLPD